MFIRIHVRGAAGCTKNLLDVLYAAKVISDLKNNGEFLSFNVRPNHHIEELCMNQLWAANVAEKVAGTPNVECEIHD